MKATKTIPRTRRTAKPSSKDSPTPAACHRIARLTEAITDRASLAHKAAATSAIDAAEMLFYASAGDTPRGRAEQLVVFFDRLSKVRQLSEETTARAGEIERLVSRG